jgi:hypothetical protein
LLLRANDLRFGARREQPTVTLIRALTSPPAETDEEPVEEQFRRGAFDLRKASKYSAGEHGTADAVDQCIGA